MKENREISAFDYCVAVALGIIDESMSLIPGIKWKPCNCGVNYRVVKDTVTGNWFLCIYPTTWLRGAHITLGIMPGERKWLVYEGSIFDNTNSAFLGLKKTFFFKFYNEKPPFILGYGVGGYLVSEMEEVLRQRIGKERAEAVLQANGVTS